MTYMNSSAALKAFCGRNGGIVCTSSNAPTVLEWAFERGQRVLFFPDQHLGRNTAKAMGVPLEEMPMWNPRKPLGGNTAADARRRASSSGRASARCTSASRSTRSSRRAPSTRACRSSCTRSADAQVVQAADAAGSTEFIVKAIQPRPPAPTLAIGTEINLVQRLAAENPEHTIFCLDPVVCPCSTMYRIHPAYLAWVLEALVAGRVVNRIKVDDDVAEPARVALERMLAAKPPASVPVPAGRRSRRRAVRGCRGRAASRA